jgi:hypothetical protein
MAVGVIDDHQPFLEGGQLVSKPAGGVERERIAIEYQLVLAADQIAIDRRHARAADALAQHRLARRGLVHVVGGGVQREQQFGARRAGGLDRAGQPNVLADRQAERRLAERKHARRLACSEIALFIEHLAVRQPLLVIGDLDAAAAQQRSRVVAQRATHLGMPHDRRQGQPRRQRRQFARTGAMKVGTQEQILRRIARQRQFRRQQQIGAQRVRLVGRGKNARGVAGEIADRAIELRDGYLQRH